MLSFNKAAFSLSVHAEFTYDMSHADRIKAFEKLRNKIPDKIVLQMALLVFPKEMHELLWDMLVGKVTAQVYSQLDREKDLESKEAAEEKKESDPGSGVTEPTQVDVLELIQKFRPDWGDMSDDESKTPTSKAPTPKAPTPKAPESDASGIWANMALTNFPILKKSDHVKTQNNRRMPAGRASNIAPLPHPRSPQASNFKDDLAGSRTSELYFGDVYTKKEKENPTFMAQDWFLKAVDPDGNPIGWRMTNGWYTSRANATFEHKKVDGAWQRRTWNKESEAWVITDQQTYVREMRLHTRYIKK
jgi:hypothetical protein